MKESYPFTVQVQYINEFSFVNPEGFISLIADDAPPNVVVDVNIEASAVNDNDYYRTNLIVKFNATKTKKGLDNSQPEEFIAFTGYLSYAATVHIDVPAEDNLLDDAVAVVEPEKETEKDKKTQYTLMVEVASLLFPFVRNLIANVTREGGFPPLLINPIDFDEMYQKNMLDNDED